MSPLWTTASASCGALIAELALRAGLGWLKGWACEPPRGPNAALMALRAGKQNTPSCGGLLLAPAWAASALVVTYISGASFAFTAATVAVALAIAGVGWIDDASKLRRGRGLRPGPKFSLLLLPVMVMVTVAVSDPAREVTWILATVAPAPARLWLDAWLGVLAVVGTAHAVNLSDGLDGLAAGCTARAAIALAAICSLQSDVLKESPIDAQTISFACLAGAAWAFGRFNRFPARVFLGDTGALFLGGTLGWIAWHSGGVAWLPLVGGVFVIETLSVVVQRSWFRWTGKRVFRCAPLHHHFQFIGVSEPNIVRQFCLAATLCAAVSVVLGSWGALGQWRRENRTVLGANLHAEGANTPLSPALARTIAGRVSSLCVRNDSSAATLMRE